MPSEQGFIRLVRRLSHNKKGLNEIIESFFARWAHQGSNLGPPDYESGALTN